MASTVDAVPASERYAKTVYRKGTSFLTEVDFRDILPDLEAFRDAAKPQLQIKPALGMLYGKMAYQQRNIGFFSDESIGYFYSKQVARSKPLGELGHRVLAAVNAQYGAQFNGILVNEYPDGSHYISAHSDDETGLDPAGVVSISLGGERMFQIKEKAPGARAENFPTKHGFALTMHGEFQKTHTHAVPKTGKLVASRISLTFRKHDPAKEQALLGKLEAGAQKRKRE
tara:strand:+ start:3464 stop:4147 length:684 start_codon:yes stop_codon:yes gene_type:complete